MKTLIKIRNLLGMIALAAAIPSALQAQKPTIFGTPNLDRSAAGPIQPGTEPAVSKTAELAVEGLDWQAQSRAAGMLVKEEKVLVEINAPAKQIAELKLRIPDRVRIQQVDTRAPNMLRMWVSAQNIHDLQEVVAGFDTAELHAYRPPVANNYGDLNTEGIQAMRSNLYEAAGLDGQGMRVAVLDIGFNGLTAAETIEVEPVDEYIAKADESGHGTAMVEVIRDVAPAAQIDIFRIDEDLDVYTATELALKRGADVIVCALSWFELPGQGLASDAARMATEKGALWVNAAGNFADGRYYENEALGTVAVGSDTFVSFDARSGDYMQFMEGWSSGQTVTLHFDQELTDATLDGTQATLGLEVYSWDGISSDFILVAAGNPGLEHQAVSFTTGDSSLYYFPMILVAQDGEIGRFRMFSPDADLYYNCAEGSVANPAAVPEVISVGAVDAGAYDEGGSLESYSSQGGGIFGSTLDLCGPANVTTGTYGSLGFSGTSAAAAHIGGLLALQLQDPMLKRDPVNLLRFSSIGNEDATGRGLAKANVDDFEPDSLPSDGAELIDEVDVAGHTLSPSSDVDWFSFTLTEDSSVDISLDRDAGIQLFSQDLAGMAYNRGNKLHKAVLRAGNYYVAVRGVDSVEVSDSLPGYIITLNTYLGAPDPVDDLTAKRDGNDVIFSWSRAEGLGSVSYQLQVAADNDFEKLLLGEDLTGTALKMTLADSIGDVFARVMVINDYGTSDPSQTLKVAAPSDDMLSGSIEDAAGGEDAISVLASQQIPAEESQDEAAGCVGTGAENGLALMLLALVGAAAALRFIRGRDRKEVLTD
jgi:subtilisin family serine protease